MRCLKLRRLLQQWGILLLDLRYLSLLPTKRSKMSLLNVLTLENILRAESLMHDSGLMGVIAVSSHSSLYVHMIGTPANWIPK